jgi:uncharacterized protein with FMN-binding domain
MHKVIPAALLTTAMVVVPVSSTFAAKSTGAKSTAAKPATHTYTGPSVDMRWGPVQVTIVVKGNAVTDLKATAPTERARSSFINNQAIPMLRQEVLQAKTATKIKNIYGISGATMTSEAFYQSLLAALKSAHLA